MPQAQNQPVTFTCTGPICQFLSMDVEHHNHYHDHPFSYLGSYPTGTRTLNHMHNAIEYATGRRPVHSESRTWTCWTCWSAAAFLTFFIVVGWPPFPFALRGWTTRWRCVRRCMRCARAARHGMWRDLRRPASTHARASRTTSSSGPAASTCSSGPATRGRGVDHLRCLASGGPAASATRLQSAQLGPHLAQQGVLHGVRVVFKVVKRRVGPHNGRLPDRVKVTHCHGREIHFLFERQLDDGLGGIREVLADDVVGLQRDDGERAQEEDHPRVSLEAVLGLVRARDGRHAGVSAELLKLDLEFLLLFGFCLRVTDHRCHHCCPYKHM